MPKQINTFTDGMVGDYDPQRQRATTYNNSLDGRVIFNEDGTLAWENAKGTKVVFSLTPGYTFLGSCEVNSKLVLFSVKDSGLPSVASEIGIVQEDVFGTYAYAKFFNDVADDPYGDRFYFDIKYPIEAHGIIETEQIERVLFGDDNEEDRVINILSNPADITVHNSAEMCDLTWGMIKFVKNIQGSLTTGKRQYCYQYISKSGYESPWSAPCDKIMVTAEQINHFDWNQYQMGASGSETSKGHQLEIKMLDTRFQRVRVACILWETDAGPKEASIIYDSDIPNTGTVTVQHTENKGTPILLEQLTQRYFEIRHSKTRLIKDSNYHKANIRFRSLLSLDTERINIVPKLRKMLSDEKGVQENPDFTSSAPLTMQQPKITSVKKSIFVGLEEEYIIDSNDNTTQKGDYINYKGTQWEHLFKGYWRGSVVPFAIVLWNRKGQAEFALPIGDFKFPEQYNNEISTKRPSGSFDSAWGNVGDYTLTDYSAGSVDPITDGSYGAPVLQGDNVVLKIMGALFSNIEMPDSLLYDNRGKLQISGFSIVRADRLKDILCQGLLMNTIAELTPYPPTNFRFPFETPKVQPLHSSGNGYIDEKAQVGGKDYFTYTATPQREKEHGSNTAGGKYAVGRIFTFEAPDFMINPAILGEQTNHYLRIVGNCGSLLSGDYITGLSGSHGHFFSKNYQTTMDGIYWYNAQSLAEPFVPPMLPGKVNFTGWGFQKQVNEMNKNLYIEPGKSIDNGYYLISNSEAFLNRYYSPLSSTTIDFQSRGHQNAIYLSTDFVNLSCRRGPAAIGDDNTPTNNVCYFIVNYRTGLAEYILDQNLLASRVYQDIGHFVPINEAVIAAARVTPDKIRFDNVEVWGGDCYVDYFSYCRLLPMFGDCETPTLDYSIGLMFPVESNYNHTMRSGIQYSKDGSFPEATVCASSVNNEQWRNGVFAKKSDDSLFRLEDFNVNSLFSFPDFRSYVDNNVQVRKYNPKGLGYTENKDFPLMEIVSNEKISGERFDSFRKFRVNNFQLADGKYNAITKLEQLGMNIYCIQQNGFSLLRYNQREMVTLESGSVSTGIAAGYGKHDFISKYGSQHQWSVVNNGRSIYFIDAEQGKQLRFGQDGMNVISDSYGQHNYFTAKTRKFWKRPQGTWDENENFFDSPLYWGGIHSVYDYKNEAVITTFSAPKTKNGGKDRWIDTEPETIEYSEAANHYKTFHSYTPGLYFNFKMNFYSQHDAEVHVHDEGNKGQVYGIFTKSKIRFVVNPAFPDSKVFDNGWLNVNPAGWLMLTKLSMSTEDQLQVINFATDGRQDYRDKQYVFPLMQKSQRTRLYGEYLTLEYEIQNAVNNQTFRLSAQTTEFRPTKAAPK